MSVKTIRQALEVALNTWATANNVTIAWQNFEFKPTINTTYIKASILPAETENPTLGDGHNRKQGIFQLLICSKDGTGMASAETLADSLLNYFSRGESFTVSGITVRILESPSVNPAFNDEGWLILPVSIRYTVDLF